MRMGKRAGGDRLARETGIRVRGLRVAGPGAGKRLAAQRLAGDQGVEFAIGNLAVDREFTGVIDL